MWLPWLGSARRAKTTAPPTPSRLSHSRSFSFSCSSFKDVQSLVQDQSPPDSHRSPSLLRRIPISTSALRTSDQGIVVYYTSLCVVRRTFEDCRAVRSILDGLRVSVDERDVSIDDRFLDELQRIAGRGNVTLPRVFIHGTYIGGAEDIRRLHESGELSRLIQRLPRVDSNGCDFCGGMRFVVCDQCDGSRKVYMEKSGFKKCTSCNISGLIRCPHCSTVFPRHTKQKL